MTLVEITPLAPAPDGLGEAFRAARRRRLRSLGAASSVGAGVLVVLVFLVGTGGQMTLVQEREPLPPAAPGPSHPVGGGSDDEQATEARASGQPGSQLTPQPGRSGGDRDVSAGSAPAKAQRTLLSAPVTRNDTGVPVPDPRCAVDANGNAHNATVCPSVMVRQADKGFSLYADLCSTGAQPTTLHYTSTHEVDFVVYRGQRAVWRWSQTHTAGPWVHELSLEPGRCRGWANEWPGVDNQGEDLPRGGYRLVAEFAAAEASEHPTWETDFTIS